METVFFQAGVINLKIAVYPGSFDPITNGHVDIIRRAAKLFDRLIVAVIHNPSKKAVFSLAEREEFIAAAVADVENVEVIGFTGLLVDFLQERQVSIIVRGLRSINDFEYESHMSMMNKHLLPEAETIFIMSDKDNLYVSSSVIKEVACLHGAVADMVPGCVHQALQDKYKEDKNF